MKKHRPTVFIIDDEKDTIDILKTVLQEDYNVITETSGIRALEILCSPQEIDATLMDLYIPDMTGAGIYSQLKIRAPERIKRLILMSAAPEMLHDFLNEVGLVVLSKPFNFDNVINCIERLKGSTASRVAHSLEDDDGEEITTGMVLKEPGNGLQIKWESQKHRELKQEVKKVDEKVDSAHAEIKKVDKKVDTMSTQQSTVLTTVRWLGVLFGIALGAIKFFEWLDKIKSK